MEYTMEYHSAMKKNEVMLFAANQMDLEIIILCEDRQRHTAWHDSYTKSLKNDTNELTYKTETDSQT